MTHMPGKDIPGEFDDWHATDVACRKCGKRLVMRRTWESSDGAYEDEQYRCGECRHTWWIESADA